MMNPPQHMKSVFLGIFVCSQSGESQGFFFKDFLWFNQSGNHWEENLANFTRYESKEKNKNPFMFLATY
jgi:hypothetical protein